MYRVLVGKPEVKRPLGSPRPRREVNIKMGFQDWFGVAWNGSMWLRIGTGGGQL